MIIKTENGEIIDTGSLTPEERHVIQKLLAWQSLVDSPAMFRQKKDQALEAGWNNSGALAETPAISLVIRHLERKFPAGGNK